MGFNARWREVRRLGYATDVGELHGNSRAVAVPVLDFDHIVIAAIETSVDNLGAGRRCLSGANVRRALPRPGDHTA
jgi:DNA-binding IclR family transcriptional regulator